MNLPLIRLPEPPGLDLARRAVAAPVRRTLGPPPPDVVWVGADPEDQGLFGPESVAWRVHADVPAMLIGGLSALLLQTLHPGAMAGVADHSSYRQDPLGRLRRTGTFLAGTTFGNTRTAEELIAAVRRRHATVTGVRPDGLPYSAADPHLLTWVHVAEVGQFLRSYQRHAIRPLRSGEVDRYYAEVAEVARRLGADEVPTSAVEMRDYYRAIRPELEAGDQAMAAVRFLLDSRATNPLERLGYDLVMQAAIAVLPHWARPMLGLWQPRLVAEAAVRPVALALCVTLRWALGVSPVVARARKQVQS